MLGGQYDDGLLIDVLLLQRVDLHNMATRTQNVNLEASTALNRAFSQSCRKCLKVDAHGDIADKLIVDGKGLTVCPTVLSRAARAVWTSARK